MKMSHEEVKKIAKLVNLSLTDKEVENLSVLFGQTLEKIQVLNELDTTNVAETFSVSGLENVFSTDQNKATLSREVALSQAKKSVKNLFSTSAVLER